MKIRALLIVLAVGLLGVAGWLVHVPNASEATQIPEKYHETVAKGLEYLVKNQGKDGHWEGDDGKHPVAMTGLVGLALLMEKQAPRGGRERVLPPAKYLANIRKAADWLIDKSQGR